MAGTIAEILQAHRSGTSPEETIARTLRAHPRAQRSGDLHHAARRGGRASPRRRRCAQKGDTSLPLYGVPFAVKDNIDVAGLPTTAACPAFAYTAESRRDLRGAAARRRRDPRRQDQSRPVRHRTRRRALALRRAAQCVRPEAHSRADRARAPASRSRPVWCRSALGTDTAGSGRVPAGLGNIVGLKPSLGVVSTAGVGAGLPHARLRVGVRAHGRRGLDGVRRDGRARTSPIPTRATARIGTLGPLPPLAHRRADQGRARVLRRSGVGRRVRGRDRALRKARRHHQSRSTSSRSTRPRGCSTKARGSPSAISRRRS